MIANPVRWRSPLAVFASNFRFSKREREVGIMPFARKMGVTPKAVYEWIAGRSCPSEAHVVTIVRLSGGALTVQDIYRPRIEMLTARANAPTPAPTPQEAAS